MMKKLMVLSLVLALGTLASAGFTKANIEAPVEVMEGQAFNIFVFGDAAAKISGGLYGLTPTSLEFLPGSGNLASGEISDEWGGVDFVVDDLMGQGVQAGQWVKLTYLAGKVGEVYTIDLYDYNVSATAPVDSFAIRVVPEPITMGLLSLGALFIRRRK